MKILFILHDLTLTGAPLIGIDIAEGFKEEEHFVHVLSLEPGAAEYHLKNKGIEYSIVSAQRRSEVCFEQAEILKALDEFDCVYINSLASVFILSLFNEFKGKIIIHAHEMLGEISSLASCNVLKKESLILADQVIAVSEEVKHDLLSYFDISKNIISVIKNPFNQKSLEEMASIPVPFPINIKGKSLSQRSKYVVCCGSSTLRKGVDYFLELADSCPDVDFVWVGDWLNIWNPVLENLEELPRKNVYFTHTVNNPYPYIKNSELFLLLSREDPDPLVVHEAILLKKPVLGFEGSGGSKHALVRGGFLISGDVNVGKTASFLEEWFKTRDVCFVPNYHFIKSEYYTPKVFAQKVMLLECMA